MEGVNWVGSEWEKIPWTMNEHQVTRYQICSNQCQWFLEIMVTFIERSFKCSWKRFTLEQHHGLCYRLTMQHSLWRGWKSCDFQNPSNLLDYLDKTPPVNKENTGVVKWGNHFFRTFGVNMGWFPPVMRRMKSAICGPCLLNDYWNWRNGDLFRVHVWHQKYTFSTSMLSSISRAWWFVLEGWIPPTLPVT